MRGFSSEKDGSRDGRELNPPVGDVVSFLSVRHIPNLLSVLRLLLSPVLLLTRPLSPAFFGVYLACGITDMTDGFLARRFHWESDFGGKLDSVGDLVFAGAALIRLLPVLELPLWLWIWTGVILLLRLWNLGWGLRHLGYPVMLHTMLNKLTGLLLFLFPMTILWISTAASAVPLCILATAAALQEGVSLRKKQDRDLVTEKRENRIMMKKETAEAASHYAKRGWEEWI